jgi:O-antigen/teichoic acid export membrane protein
MHTKTHRLKTFLTSAGFKKYFTNTSWLFIGRLINMVVGFFAATYMIRALGPGSYGALSYILSFAGLGSVIANLGIEQILSRELIKHPEQRGMLLGTGFFVKIFGAILSCVVLGISSIISGNDTEVTLLILLVSSSYFFSAFNVLNILFQSDVHSKPPTIVSIIVASLLAVLKITAIFIGLPISYLIVIFFLEPVFYAIGFSIIYLHYYSQKLYKFTFNIHLSLSLLTESWPLIISWASIAVYSRIDQVMLQHYIDGTAVGLYDAAVRIAELWYFIPGIIASSLFPALISVHGKMENTYNLRIQRLYFILWWSGITISATCVIFAPLILDILYGSIYTGAATVLRLYALGTIPVFLTIPIYQHLIAEKLPMIFLFSSFVGMVSNLTLNVFLIPIYGINGAALATCISYSLVPLSILMFKKTRSHGILTIQSLIRPNI